MTALCSGMIFNFIYLSAVTERFSFQLHDLIPTKLKVIFIELLIFISPILIIYVVVVKPRTNEL
jgi:hypothetical protein